MGFFTSRLQLPRLPARTGRVLIAAVLSVFLAQTLTAQRNTWENASNLPVSPEVQPDRHVTFRLYAPKATEVLVIGGPLGEAKALENDGHGLWSLTVGPLEPGYYNYGFAIDGGIRSPDPSNPNIEPRRWGHTSYFEVPGSQPLIHQQQLVPHGTLHINTYSSKALKQTRQFYVYTPPGYENSASRYPVLFLLHGSGLVERAWIDAGRANEILDNLIAAGKARPMVLVMPYGHVNRAMTPGERGGGSSSDIENDVVGDVLPAVESLYRLLPGRENRAIAGLSLGGTQAMRFGLHHLNLFSAIGSFAGNGGRTELEEVGAETLNGRLAVLYIGYGTTDPAMASNKRALEWLDQNNVRHEFRSYPGGHIWPVWQKDLAEFASMLFPNGR